MAKVSIVGVRGSGKTVLLAALGDKYQLPDENGMFFKASDAETFAFVQKQMTELRAGRWPVGTQADRMQHVNWRLMKRRSGAAPISVGEVSMLDFAGEVYTAAFGGTDEAERGDVSDEVKQLRDYVATSDRLVVLVNIADLCNSPNQTDPEVLKTLWASMGILDFAAEKGEDRVAIGLSQYERFRALSEECGGPLETLRKYAPFLYSAYGHLPLFTLTAVDKTVSDAEGRPIPAPNFASQGLESLMSWILEDDSREVASQKGSNKTITSGPVTQSATEKVVRKATPGDSCKTSVPTREGRALSRPQTGQSPSLPRLSNRLPKKSPSHVQSFGPSPHVQSFGQLSHAKSEKSSSSAKKDSPTPPPCPPVSTGTADGFTTFLCVLGILASIGMVIGFFCDVMPKSVALPFCVVVGGACGKKLADS